MRNESCIRSAQLQVPLIAMASLFSVGSRFVGSRAARCSQDFCLCSRLNCRLLCSRSRVGEVRIRLAAQRRKLAAILNQCKLQASPSLLSAFFLSFHFCFYFAFRFQFGSLCAHLKAQRETASSDRRLDKRKKERQAEIGVILQANCDCACQANSKYERFYVARHKSALGSSSFAFVASLAATSRKQLTWRAKGESCLRPSK